MAESLTKKTSPIKKVRFNEKVQVFIIKTENKRSTTLRNLPSDWIRFAHAKPLSEKLKQPLNRTSTLAFGTGHLTPRQYRPSEDLINFYLQRRAKQPFTYWDVMKANPLLALTPTIQIAREDLTTPAKRGLFPTTHFPHQRRFSTLAVSQPTTTSPFQRRMLDKSGQFSEILAIYGNNPSLRTNKQAELLIGNFKDTQVGEVKGAIHEKLNKTLSHERKMTSSTEIFPYFERPQGFTQRPLKSTSYFLYK